MTYKIIDTNIVLLRADNMMTLGQDGSVVVLPETLLSEVDGKKAGMEEINYQARQVGRLIASAELLGIDKTDFGTVTRMELEGVQLRIVSLNEYEASHTEYGGNDKRIIQVATTIQGIAGDGDEVKFITNDVLCMLQALAVGLDASDLKVVEDDGYEFVKELQ